MSEKLLRPVGLIGGMSWQSTQIYYARINQGVSARLGGNHSAPLWMYSFDFAEIEALQEAGQWARAGQVMADIARRLEDAGAQALVICTNTMHKLGDVVQNATTIPLLHIVEATARAILASEAQNSLLLATRYTMTQDFYRAPLGQILANDNRSVMVPPIADQGKIHAIIYDELCRGIIRDDSRKIYQEIFDRAATEFGCDSVILGCTEIGLLIGQHDTSLQVFDTTALHCDMVLDFICS